jgi:hypothetical protein
MEMLGPALLLSTAALAGSTPQALLTTLVKTPIVASELPAGFSHPRIARQPLGANGRKYHAIGLVAVSVKGPDAEDAFAFEVFRNHADAIADLDHPALTNGVKVVDTVPGFRESLVLTGTLSGLHLDDAATVVGNVLIQSVTGSKRGNRAGAIALLRAAVAHLKKVR